jgi:tetratricopeptide (TPR) repeat protein
VAQLWLALLTLAVYVQSMTYGVVYDDRETVPSHKTVSESWSTVSQYFTRDLTSEHNSNFYRPLSALFCRVMTSIFGSNAAGWHICSVLLHVLCVLLVFALGRRLLHSRTTAFFAAALFAVHPTHVEAVTWISALGDPLMTVFLLASAVAFLRWLQGETHAWLAASLATCAAAIFTKETAVVTPALISVLILLPQSVRSRRAQLTALTAFWGEAFAFLAIRSHILHGFSHPLSQANNAEMLMTWPGAVAFYVRHMIFPAEMTPLYDFDFVRSAGSPGFLWPLFALIALSAALAWLLRKSTHRRLYVVCLAWILVPLAPVMYLKLFPPYELVHDRYLYISTIGLCIAAAAAITSLARRAGSPAVARLTAILLIGVSAAATVGYESWWQSDLTLFKRVVSITPNNVTGLVNLGFNLLETKQYASAIRVLDRAMQLAPDNATVIFDRGRAAWETGDSVNAERYLERSAQLAPDVTRWLYLAGVELSIGKWKEGEFASRQALAIGPTEPNVHFALGLALLDEGNKPAAISEFEEELSHHPDSLGTQKALEQARAQN